MRGLTECLAQAPVFSKLPERDRLELAAHAIERKYRKNDFVCYQGENFPYVGYLAAGKLEWVMASPEGRRQVIFSLHPCDVIWSHTVVDDLPMPASLEVRADSRLYLWDRQTILPVVQRSAQAVWDISQILMKYMRNVRDVIYGFAFQPVAGRLARLLLRQYQPLNENRTPRNLTLDQMAETVGTTRELISRTLHRFADEGIISINRVEFAFLDREKLESLAGSPE